MQNNMWKKGLVIGIIVLFVGASVLPSISGNTGKMGIAQEMVIIKDNNKLEIMGSPPEVQWMKTYGGMNEDLGASVQQIKDGGYIIAGATESYGAQEVNTWLIKTDKDGNEQWNKTYSKGHINAGFCIQQTSDEGYIISGYMRNSVNNLWLIKTDVNGIEHWNKTFGGLDYAGGGWSVQQTTDLGFILTGFIRVNETLNESLWLIKIDKDGIEQWNRTYGGRNKSMGMSVQQTKDEGYILCGAIETHRQGSVEGWLIKTDQNGNVQWNRTFGIDEYSILFSSIEQTSDNSYILTGSIHGINTNKHGTILLKTDINGKEQWNRTFWGSGDSQHDTGWMVRQINNSGYIILTTDMNHSAGPSNHDVWLIKTDVNGNEQWNTTYGGPNNDYGFSIQQTNDGGYIITGDTGPDFVMDHYDAFLLKIAPEDTQPPNIKITTPEKRFFYLNFKDRIIFKIPFLTTLIIGQIDIEVDAEDGISGVDKVEFYIDDELEYNDTAEPYNWTWDEQAFFRHTIKVTAYDNAGNSASDEIKVWKFF